MKNEVNILILDDESVIRETLAAILEEEGYNVTTAEKGKEAIEQAKRIPFNLAIIDFKLPDIDGISVLLALKEINPYLCALMITAYGTMETTIKALEKGVYDFITKPFELAHIISVIRRGLEEQHLIFERDELLKNLQKEKEKLETILHLGRKMASILEMNELTNFIVNSVSEIVNVERCSLMLLEEASGSLVIKAAKGLEEKIIAETKIRLGEGISGWVAQSGETLLVEDIGKYPHWTKKGKYPAGTYSPYRTKSFLILPLMSKNKLFGVLNLTDKKKTTEQSLTEFGEEDLKFLQIVATQSASAIENAQLYSNLSKMASTDALTGLYNHGTFHERLLAEIDRFRRYKHLFSLIMFDIDNFKNYNDNNGHLKGDDVLRQIGRILKASTRRADTAARYGGEEFAVIMPETDLKSVLLAAEKIRQKVEEHVFEGEENQPQGCLTISGGVTTYRNGLSSDGLIYEADEALYQAKRSGKNKICVFETTERPQAP